MEFEWNSKNHNLSKHFTKSFTTLEIKELNFWLVVRLLKHSLHCSLESVEFILIIFHIQLKLFGLLFLKYSIPIQ